MRVALITGASSGIGRALAIEATRLGYAVGLMARSLEGLNETVQACSALFVDPSKTKTAQIITTVGIRKILIFLCNLEDKFIK